MARRGKKSRSKRRKQKNRADDSSARLPTDAGAAESTDPAGTTDPRADPYDDPAPGRAEVVDLDAEVGEIASRKLVDRLIAEAMAVADSEYDVDDVVSTHENRDAEPTPDRAGPDEAASEPPAVGSEPETPAAAQAERAATPGPEFATDPDTSSPDRGRAPPTFVADDTEGVEVFDLDMDADIVTEEALVARPKPEPSEAPTPSTGEANAQGPSEPTGEGAEPGGVDPAPHPDSTASTADVLDLSALVGASQPAPPPSIDLGPGSTPAARARLLAEALAHAEMQEARYRVPTGPNRSGRRKGMVALAVFSIAGVVAIAPPAAIVPEPGPELVESDHDRGIRMTLLLQVQQIEAYRAREGRLPTSLADVAAELPGVRYVRSGSRLYQLIAYAPNGDPVIYDSATPAAAFADLTPAWLAGGGG